MADEIMRCPMCSSTMLDDAGVNIGGTVEVKCQSCGFTGKIVSSTYLECPICDGRGRRIDIEDLPTCDACEGTGIRKADADAG